MHRWGAVLRVLQPRNANADANAPPQRGHPSIESVMAARSHDSKLAQLGLGPPAAPKLGMDTYETRYGIGASRPAQS